MVDPSDRCHITVIDSGIGSAIWPVSLAQMKLCPLTSRDCWFLLLLSVSLQLWFVAVQTTKNLAQPGWAKSDLNKASVEMIRVEVLWFVLLLLPQGLFCDLEPSQVNGSATAVLRLPGQEEGKTSQSNTHSD